MLVELAYTSSVFSISMCRRAASCGALPVCQAMSCCSLDRAHLCNKSCKGSKKIMTYAQNIIVFSSCKPPVTHSFGRTQWREKACCWVWKNI